MPLNLKKKKAQLVRMSKIVRVTALTTSTSTTLLGASSNLATLVAGSAGSIHIHGDVNIAAGDICEFLSIHLPSNLSNKTVSCSAMSFIATKVALDAIK